MKPLSSLIKEKKFDYVNSHITDDLFLIPEKISSDYKLFYFNRSISSEEAIKEMKAAGYLPANAWELLSWKEWNEEDLVVALGSVGKVGGDRLVPYLGRRDSERYLNLYWWDSDWNADCRFLGVRDSSLSTSKPKKSALGASDTLTLPAELIINGITYVKK